MLTKLIVVHDNVYIKSGILQDLNKVRLIEFINCIPLCPSAQRTRDIYKCMGEPMSSKPWPATLI